MAMLNLFNLASDRTLAVVKCADRLGAVKGGRKTVDASARL